MGKRFKKDTCLYTLPDQVVEKIGLYAGSEAMVQLASLSRHFRQEFAPFVFKNVKATWYTLQDPEFQAFFKEHCEWVHQVRVVDSYSYGEWQIDVFDRFFNSLPNLHRLVVNSFNSSNWLKYRHNHTLHTLQMYYDFAHNETESLHQNPNPKNIRRLYKPKNLPKIFNLHHLEGFPRLVKLHLDNYHFNWEDPFSVLSLQHITLVNCTWEYPFTTAKFNENNSVLQFQLVYTKDHPFLLSERFIKFLNEPFAKGCNIRRLVVRLEHCERSYYLSMGKLRPFLDDEIFPRLEELDFSGWRTDDKTLLGYLKAIGKVQIRKLVVNSTHNGVLQYPQFPQLLVESTRP